MVTEHYDHIWDCCCDHGLLGLTLLERKAAYKIHFVDIVPELISSVEQKLQRFYSQDASQWQVHCMDVAKLPLEHHAGKHLVIIAGVGGDLITQFIAAIHAQNPEIDIDFILCPVHHLFTLRHQLNQLHFTLKDEVLVKDNQRFYEVIKVSSTVTNQRSVSLVGDKIWRAQSAEQVALIEEYKNKTLQHYQRIQQGNKKDVSEVIAQYTQIELKSSY